ncbi:hypothetical protein MKEN_00950400 [Mycena kentingensis (nom. inval.)]|nr:hypothetical protein MKEN_00950400 [Mycena kentingensis (nom. inval.)]
MSTDIDKAFIKLREEMRPRIERKFEALRVAVYAAIYQRPVYAEPESEFRDVVRDAVAVIIKRGLETSFDELKATRFAHDVVTSVFRTYTQAGQKLQERGEQQNRTVDEKRSAPAEKPRAKRPREASSIAQPACPFQKMEADISKASNEAYDKVIAAVDAHIFEDDAEIFGPFICRAVRRMVRQRVLNDKGRILREARAAAFRACGEVMNKKAIEVEGAEY